MKLEAAKRLLLADGEWFDALTDDMKEQYVKEHPESKYAKGWKRKGNVPATKPGTQVAPTNQSPQQKPQQKRQVQQVKKQPPANPGGTPKAKQAIHKLPAKGQQFIKSGDTAAGSKSRKALGKTLKKRSKAIAKNVYKDNKQLAHALTSIPNILQDKGSKSDWKNMRKIGLTVLGSAALAGALGVSGPAGFLTFMALKHIAKPALGNLVKQGIKRLKTQGPEQDESEVKHVSSAAWKASGNKGISPYGYWKDRNTWISETKKEWESKYDEREDDADDWDDEDEDDEDDNHDSHFHRNHNRNRRRHAALIVAADEPDDEQMIQAVVDMFSTYASEGNIPDEAWDASVEEYANDHAGMDEQRSPAPQSRDPFPNLGKVGAGSRPLLRRV